MRSGRDLRGRKNPMRKAKCRMGYRRNERRVIEWHQLSLKRSYCRHGCNTGVRRLSHRMRAGGWLRVLLDPKRNCRLRMCR